VTLLTPQARFLAFFSKGQISSPVSATPPGECNAIKNKCRGEGDLTPVTLTVNPVSNLLTLPRFVFAS